MLLSAAPGRAVTAAGWWDPAWPYRVPVTVNAADYARNNKPVELAINFTTLLQTLGHPGTFAPNSIRVVEVDDADNVINANVPFQFDQASNYNATNNAAGTLIFLMNGSTTAAQTRHYQVYFDVTGGGQTLPTFTDQVVMTSITDSFGYDTLKLVTSAGTYHYHKTGGGFASLIDSGANDWISWNTAAGNAGDFRGIPNMVYPNDGGYFHPGRNSATTTTVYDGPLRASFKSVSSDGKWEVLWDVFPASARMTVLKVDATKKYWFLYEGTPGGTLETATDLVTRSDGTQTTAGTSWSGDIAGEEWVFFTDPGLSRSLFVIHHQEDDKVDSYRASSPDALMTILGFGRSVSARYLEGTDRQLSFGLANQTSFNSVRTTIHNVYKPLNISLGIPEVYDDQAPTATPTTPTSTSTFTPTPTSTSTSTSIPTITSTSIPTSSPTATTIPSATSTATSIPTDVPTASVTATATLPAPAEHLIYLGAVFAE